MVAKIKTGKSLMGALQYNERKVSAGKAALLGASGFPKEAVDMSFQDKLFRLTDLAARNQRTHTNTMHLSLNFAQADMIDDGKLLELVESYMEMIGFGNQPFLVYRHFDAGHPHVHILTTNIQSNGQRISFHQIGRDRSEPARKELETRYGLVRAEEQQKEPTREIVPVNYLDGDIKRSITNIVNQVVADYRFSSLPEMNAVLGRYQVKADRGSERSVMYKKGGLLYWVLDPYQEKIGVPIKASSIYRKPTLKLLQARFKMNSELRKPYREQLRLKIEKAVAGAQDPDAFKQNLNQLHADVIYRQNAEGRLYGVAFIDDESRCVFNGSDLGKAYSANAIAVRLNFNQLEKERAGSASVIASEQVRQDPAGVTGAVNRNGSLLEILMQPEFTPDQLPADLRRSRKKKKRRLNL